MPTLRNVSTGRFTKFLPNPAFWVEARLTPQMLAHLKGLADKVTAEAKLIAHREVYDKGFYYRGLRSAAGIDKAAGSMPTAIARTNAFDFKSAWIEWGTKGGPHMRAHHVLTRAATAAGLKTVGKGKNLRRIGGTGREWSSTMRNAV